MIFMDGDMKKNLLSQTKTIQTEKNSSIFFNHFVSNFVRFFSFTYSITSNHFYIHFETKRFRTPTHTNLYIAEFNAYLCDEHSDSLEENFSFVCYSMAERANALHSVQN